MNALFVYFLLGFITIVFCLGAFLFSIFYHVIPSTAISQGFLQTLYGMVFGFFDASFLILLLIFIVTGIIQVYANPNKGAGIVDIALVLSFAFLYLSLKTPFLGIENALYMNIYLPNTSAIVNSNWTAFLVLGALALEAIFNFKSE